VTARRDKTSAPRLGEPGCVEPFLGEFVIQFNAVVGSGMSQPARNLSQTFASVLNKF